MASTPQSVGVIGSFRRNYKPILDVVRALRELGMDVTSPKGEVIVDQDVEFVRFECDLSEYDDLTVQAITLHRLLRADFVYVVAPEGYVGRTTCYEIGRLLQARAAVYFSEVPKDLPISVPASHNLPLRDLVAAISLGSFLPTFTFANTDASYCAQLEREVTDGIYVRL